MEGDFDSLVLHMAIPGRRRVAEDAEAGSSRPVRAKTGTTFVQWTLDQGWPDLENPRFPER